MRFWIRYPLGMGLFFLSVFWGWFVYLWTRSPARTRKAVADLMAGSVCRMILLDVQLSGLENLPGDAPCIVVGNHQGHVDEPVLAHVYRHLHHPVIVAKMGKLYTRGPVRGLFERTGNIAVGKNPSAEGARILRVAREALARGSQLAMYPEGTRSRDGRLGPFKLGAFLLAVDSGVPVVPVVVSRYAPEFDPRNRHLEPHVARVRVLEPVPTAGLKRTDVGALRDEVWARMKRVLDEDESGDGDAPETEPAPERP